MKLARNHYILIFLSILTIGTFMSLIGPCGKPKVSVGSPFEGRRTSAATRSETPVEATPVRPVSNDSAAWATESELHQEERDAWPDPFKGITSELAELEVQIRLKEKEVELLKVQVEEAKLRKELGLSTNRRTYGSTGSYTPRAEVKAIIVAETERSALVKLGSSSYWIAEGETVAGCTVKEIEDNAITVTHAGRTYRSVLNSGS
jgi:hypothetical protein